MESNHPEVGAAEDVTKSSHTNDTEEAEFGEEGENEMDYLEDFEEEEEEVDEEEDENEDRTSIEQTSSAELEDGDYRMEWLKRQTCLYLNEHDTDIFDEMLLNEKIHTAITDFFDTDLADFSLEEAAKKRAVFLYKLFEESEYDMGFGRVAEEEEMEEATGSENTDTTTSTQKGSKGKKKKKKGKGKGKGKKKKKGKKKSKSSSKSKTKKGKKKKKKKKGKGGKKKKRGKKSSDETTTGDLTTVETTTFPWDDDTDVDVESLPDDSRKRYFEFAATSLPSYFRKLNPYTMYLIRVSRIPIPPMRTMKEAEAEMPKHLMSGTLHGFNLKSIHAVLSKIYAPLIYASDLNAPVRRLSQTKIEMQPMSDQQKHQLKEELTMELQKFLGILDRSISQMEGEIKLTINPIPELDIPESNLAALARNKQLVLQLEEVCALWEAEISRILESDLPKKPSSFTPLAELEFWRDRNALLAVLSDQLQSNQVRNLISVLDTARSGVLPGFQYQQQELTRNLQEARDITRFLGTIERLLKTITYSHSFSEMADAIPHIMEGLQLVWMLSRHYNKDERMCNLLEMIGKLFYDRVTAALHPKSLFRKDPLTAMALAESARSLLIAWKECYMNTRDQIEQSGKGTKWEFDRSKLFPKTDYCAIIAQHLSEIVGVLLEFQNFFGPEIKAVVGDPKRIEDALRKTQLLVKPFIDLTGMDPFLSANNKAWNELLDQLRKDVLILETEAKIFFDEAFRGISNADSAFEMLMKFKFIETREGIHAKLMKKFDDTLMIYIQEVRKVKEFYEANKDRPLLPKYNPPFAGRIWWVRSLFYYIKRSIVRFRTQQDVISTEIGQLACQEYLNLAKDMKNYEDTWYQTYCDGAVKTMSTCLRKNVFVKVPATNELGKNLSVSKSKKVYKVNIPIEVIEMVQEALHLEQMGYRITESVRNLALQRKQYTSNCRVLTTLLETYYSIRRRLNPYETELMEKTIKDIEKSFDQGTSRLTWTALGIPDYAATVNSTLQQFEGVVNQVNKVAKDVRVRVFTIKQGFLFKEPPYKKLGFGMQVLDCWDFFQYWDKQRARVWEKLVLQYRGLNPLFLKLETLIYNSSTGKLKPFHHYFITWEKRIFHFLTKMIIRSLYAFERRMILNDPLFDIEVALHTPDIRISPTPHEIYIMVTNAARDCVEGSKSFVRWMRGTCIETPGVFQGAEREKFIYSYYLDIGRVPRILELLLKIQENVQTLLRNIWDHLRKYRKFKNLWRFNKERTCEAFSLKNPPVSCYDDKMAFYTQIVHRVSEMPSYKIEGCIRLHTRPLLSAICRHAREWVVKLGQFLSASTKARNIEFERIVAKYETDLRKLPRNVDELKAVFLTIQSVMDSAVDMEARYVDLTTRYSVLSMYNVEVSEEEQETLHITWKKWQMLWLHEIKLITRRMEAIKEKFDKITTINK